VNKKAHHPVGFFLAEVKPMNSAFFGAMDSLLRD